MGVRVQGMGVLRVYGFECRSVGDQGLGSTMFWRLRFWEFRGFRIWF